MAKKLTRIGDDLALVLDKATLEATGTDADTPLEISADADIVVSSPASSTDRAAKLKQILERLDRVHADAFRRLAE